jgi:hypothetical protein
MTTTPASCCYSQPHTSETGLQNNLCPISGSKGKSVQLITLKSLLTSTALASLDVSRDYCFCKDASCDIVYFGALRSYHRHDLKVRVHQKEKGPDVPVCYCFDWTPATITAAVSLGKEASIIPFINAHIKSARCGCEVNNPQGFCCLMNVTAVLKEVAKAEITP